MEKKDYPRQSKDFKEIINLQTNMKVEQEEWDKLFHNWNDPERCSLRKLNVGCSICKKLEELGKEEK